MAWRTSSSARVGSAISPLRTPRDLAWPRPTILSEASVLSSPTTAQTFEVPISRPTIIEEGSNMLFLEMNRTIGRDGCGGGGAGFEPANGDAVGNGQVNGRHRFFQFQAQIIDEAPSHELAIEVVQRQGDDAALAGADDEHLCCRDI